MPAPRGDVLTFNDFIGLNNLQPTRTDPTPYLGSEPWLTVTIQTNGTPTQSATTGTLTIKAGNWTPGLDSQGSPIYLSLFGLNALNSSNYSFTYSSGPDSSGFGPSTSSTGIDSGGNFGFKFAFDSKFTAGQTEVLTISNTTSFWNASSFAQTSNSPPFNFYSEAILNSANGADLYIYETPEPSRFVGVVGTALMGFVAMCIASARRWRRVIS